MGQVYLLSPNQDRARVPWVAIKVTEAAAGLMQQWQQHHSSSYIEKVAAWCIDICMYDGLCT